MVCFETKEEANIAIQDLNETTRYEPKKQRKMLIAKIKLTPLQQKKKNKRETC